MGARGELGRDGEQLAVEYLLSVGMQVLERNWRCPAGEVDIVARDADCLVVCEVKTRRVRWGGGPLDAVTPVKLARLRRLTGLWLAGQDRRFGAVRVDVVGVLRPAEGPDRIEHLRGVA